MDNHNYEQVRNRSAHKDDGSQRHPGIAALLNAMEQGHLPEDYSVASKSVKPFLVTCRVMDLAYRMVDLLPEGPELTAGLRKLLEAEDCFLRAQRDIK